jgi:hypothetical protein
VLITLEISQRHESLLIPFVDAYNIANNTALTLEQWALLHLKEVAVGPRVTQEYEQIQREEESTRNDRQTQARERALADL